MLNLRIIHTPCVCAHTCSDSKISTKSVFIHGLKLNLFENIKAYLFVKTTTV